MKKLLIALLLVSGCATPGTYKPDSPRLTGEEIYHMVGGECSIIGANVIAYCREYGSTKYCECVIKR
jgi:hypothetical protein